MKKMLIGLLVILSLATVSCEGVSETSCYNSVQSAFPNAKTIFTPPHSSFRFIIIDADSTVWYAETMKVSTSTITFKCIVK